MKEEIERILRARFTRGDVQTAVSELFDLFMSVSGRSEQCLGGNMKDPKEESPKNMSVVLVETKIGPLSFAYYKDGMFRLSGCRSWIHPDEIRGWISMSDLKSKLSI